LSIASNCHDDGVPPKRRFGGPGEKIRQTMFHRTFVESSNSGQRSLRVHFYLPARLTKKPNTTKGLIKSAFRGNRPKLKPGTFQIGLGRGHPDAAFMPLFSAALESQNSLSQIIV